MSAPTKVYAFCNSGNGTDMQGWYAMAENGVVICAHLSSSRGWGLHDVSPQMHPDAYEKALGADYEIELIEVPAHQLPPPEVVERNRQLAVADGVVR